MLFPLGLSHPVGRPRWQWSSSKQSVLALIGATLGFTGTIFTIFVTIKQRSTYHLGSVLGLGDAETAKVTPDSSATSGATPSRVSVVEDPVRQRWTSASAPAPHFMPPPEEEYYL